MLGGPWTWCTTLLYTGDCHTQFERFHSKRHDGCNPKSDKTKRSVSSTNVIRGSYRHISRNRVDKIFFPFVSSFEVSTLKCWCSKEMRRSGSKNRFLRSAKKEQAQRRFIRHKHVPLVLALRYGTSGGVAGSAFWASTSACERRAKTRSGSC